MMAPKWADHSSQAFSAWLLMLKATFWLLTTCLVNEKGQVLCSICGISETSAFPRHQSTGKTKDFVQLNCFRLFCMSAFCAQKL